MADYYPLLARALDALPDRSPALRKAVYERARNALISQLRSLDPPLSDDDIELERRALDKAIARLEIDHGGIPAPANDIPAPAVTAPNPPDTPSAGSVRPPDLHEPALPTAAAATFAAPAAASPPSLPAAASPSFAPIPVAASEPEPREAPIPIATRRPRRAEPEARKLEADTRSDVPGTADSTGAIPVEDIAPDAANGRQRPRIAVVSPRAGRSRILRNAFVGIVLALVIGSIAVAAFLLRDKPPVLQAADPDALDTQQPDGEAKFGDRVGGEAAPDRAVPSSDGAPQRQPAPTRGEAVPVQPGVSVAQRAVLLQEGAGGEGAQPTSTVGRVTWRLETVNGEQGQPLQNAVVATLTFSDAGSTLVMTIQRNLDATLPASHTVSLAFSQTGADAAARVVQDVGLLQAKDDETARGSPVSGLPVRVRENLFLIGLSSLRNDVERNSELLLRRNWFDIAVRYTSGKRAVLTFEKGTNGAQVLQNAFNAWQ